MKLQPFPGKLERREVERPFTTKTGRRCVWKSRVIVLTDEQREWLCRWFPEVENSRLAEASGMSLSMLHRFARELHLTKSERGMRGIKRRQAAHIKRVCERNGYYDSLRGGHPSDACLQGTARMWQEIREGKREHPFSQMKRKHPRKYRELMKRKSEERREAIRKEKRRIVYGMERKTSLKMIVMCPYTRSQLSHRYNALKRGYVIVDDCTEQGGERYNIYYDSDTRRAPIFERHLAADGFHLLPWEE